MNDSTASMDYRDRSLILRLIGVGLLLLGVGSAFIGPLEMYCFYLFSDGGRFHYEGFGFGSIMFANIAAQIGGYYLIAAIGIPLGYAHLKRRRWARAATLALLWFWLVLGLPLTAALYLIWIDAKEPSLTAFLVSLPFGAILYPVAPILLIRLYQSRDVRATFAHHDPEPSALEAIPLAVRVLCVLLGFTILTLHIPILLNGVFPWFGRLLSGLEGIAALDGSIMALAGLTWGLARLKRWAWWGSLGALGLMTISTIVTFSRHTVRGVLLAMSLPAFEAALFRNVPILDRHPTLAAVVPLLVALACLVVAGRHYRGGAGAATLPDSGTS